MHGLINRAIQCFVHDTYGEASWMDIARHARLDDPWFEAVLRYDQQITFDVLEACETVLGKPLSELLEDIGTYLVSHNDQGAVRRLLRFSGADFIEFLHSLDDLPDRARLAVPDLDLPRLTLRDHAPTRFTLEIYHSIPGFGAVLLGVLRALADDYGALAVLEYRQARAGCETISIDVVAQDFSEGRSFSLVAPDLGAA